MSLTWSLFDTHTYSAAHGSPSQLCFKHTRTHSWLTGCSSSVCVCVCGTCPSAAASWRQPFQFVFPQSAAGMFCLSVGLLLLTLISVIWTGRSEQFNHRRGCEMSNMISGTVMCTYTASHLSFKLRRWFTQKLLSFFYGKQKQTLNNLDIRLIRNVLWWSSVKMLCEFSSFFFFWLLVQMFRPISVLFLPACSLALLWTHSSTQGQSFAEGRVGWHSDSFLF